MINDNKLEGLILAAGISSRFNFMDSRFKKYFLKLNNSNILGFIIAGMIKTRIKKIKIVTSKTFNKLKFKKRILKSVSRSLVDLNNLDLDIIENKIPERENGFSLFLGLNSISSEYTLLSMADHIFSKNIFSKMRRNYKKKDILLATDPMNKKGYYDKEDATKVFGENTFIKNIGKDLMNYNRLDMGVFILKTKKIKRICGKIESNFHKFGVTDVIMSALSSDLNVGYYDFPNTIWLDIDDYRKYCQLKKLFSKASNIHPFGLIPTESITFNTKSAEVNND
ncbi:MAG: NTP transferase domain-containing protein [Promethearchaeota archaeon]